MTVNEDQTRRELHPLHGALLAGTIPLFLGALLSDLAYAYTYQIEWNNFASWLIVGGLIFGGFTLLWAIINQVRTKILSARSLVYTLLLLVTWILGFGNSLIHAKDAWASMPVGLILSAIVFLLACASTLIGFTKFGVGGGK